MKQPFVRFIALVILASTLCSTAYADSLFRKPKRRQKQYMSQEQIAAKQDSIDKINSPVSCEVTTITHTPKATTAEKKINTPQQNDSLRTK